MSGTASAVEQAAKCEGKPPMKTLANCTPVEFLRQTNKIRHAAADLLGAAGIAEIRKRMPSLTGGESEGEKEAALKKQGAKNFSDILDALLDVNAEGTAALLGMMCFQEPDDMENATGMEYLEAGLELLKSKPVMDFLLMLAGSVPKNMDA